MPDSALKTAAPQPSPAGIEALKRDLNGKVVLPHDDAYESARKIWNGMVDRRPALIVRCLHTSDVVRALQFARDSGLPLAVRGGGHNIAGNATCDGGIVIDLSQMNTVSVNPRLRRAQVGGGALLADLDAATQAHGLATPVGINSTTGIGGLTLGGGFGWLSRKHGLTVDNLESAEVVTADGKVVRASASASASEHPDLFWAIRGGGGNFGIVTRFEFRLHPVGPQVLSGLIVYPTWDGQSVLRKYRDFMAQAPDELLVWCVLRKAPPLPFLPQEAHGKDIIALALCYAGDPVEGERLAAPLRKLGALVGAHVGVRWARDVFEATAPFANGGVYVNFMTADEGERVRSAYGPNYDRLVRVKRQYDPKNLFRLNQNISPKE